MEDKDFKNLWNELDKMDENMELNIDQIVKKKSQSIIQRFMRNIKFELVMNILLIPFLVWICITVEQFLLLWVGVIILVLVFIWMYIRLIRDVEKVNPKSETVSYLTDVAALFQKLVKVYKVLSVILLSAFYFLWTCFLDSDEGDFEFGIIRIVSMIIGLVIAYLLVFLFIDILYQKKVRSLQKLISEIQNGEEG